MLIEEIIAAMPRASALEMACRVIRREKNFVPSIAEVLAVLKEQTTRWDAMMELDAEKFTYAGERLERVARNPAHQQVNEDYAAEQHPEAVEAADDDEDEEEDAA